MSDHLEDLLEKALDLVEAGVAPDLLALAGGDEDVAARLADLLDLDQQIDPPALADPLVGQLLAERYRLVQGIGIGATGVVYEATDTQLQRLVAIKILRNPVLADSARFERFQREARVLAALSHPNVVDLFDHGCTAEGTPFLVMRLLEGGTAAAQLEHHFHASSPEAIEAQDASWLARVLRWGTGVGAALVAAHREGIAHRDLKPSNVFVTGEDDAVLLDFGIADLRGEDTLTADGATIGSPWYMAPEQVGGNAPISELVDVYGLGATLYHLVGGSAPYAGTYAEVVAQLIQRDPVPLRQLLPSADRDLCAVIERAMERQPERRYPSMEAFLADLEALREARPVSARPLSPAVRWVRAVRRKSVPAVAALVASLVLLTGFPLGIWLQERTQAEQTQRAQRLYQLRAALDPNLGFSGRSTDRESIAEQVGPSAQSALREILAIDPEAKFERLQLAALLADALDHEASLEELRRLTADHDTPFLNALLERAQGHDPSAFDREALRAWQRPAPQSALGRIVLAFYQWRARDAEAVHETLDGLAGYPAATIRVGAVFARAAAEASEGGGRAAFDPVFAAVDALEAAVGGPTARSEHYRAAVYLSLRESELAVRSLERARLLAPRLYGILINLGTARLDLDQPDRALPSFRAAASLRPRYGAPYIGAAQALARLYRWDEALAELEKHPEPKRGTPLYEPWHLPYTMAYVEAGRAVRLRLQGVEAGVAAAEQKAHAHCTEAVRLAAGDAKAEARVAAIRSTLGLHEGPAFQNANRLLMALDDDLEDPVLRGALLLALDRADRVSQADYQEAWSDAQKDTPKHRAALGRALLLNSLARFLNSELTRQ